ncbi:MAG: hypothetical protein C4297_14280 [Gemmataceae bacterium]
MNQKRSVPPLLSSSDRWRLVSLLVMTAVVIWAIWKAGDPRTWTWTEMLTPSTEKDAGAAPAPDAAVATAPQSKRSAESASDLPTLEQSYYAQATMYLSALPATAFGPGWPVALVAARAGAFTIEWLPLPEKLISDIEPLTQHAPPPDPTTLAGALDYEPFRLEAEDDPGAITWRRDADARYHLIHLALSARSEDLARDALAHVRYSALRVHPERYRGRVLRIEGDLRKLDYFELHRPVPGATHLYQAWVTTGSLDQLYCLLVHELPNGMPPESQWHRLYQRVRFDGYFLKILKVRDEQKTYYVPVLIGKTLHTLRPAAARRDHSSIISVVLTMILGGLLLCLVLTWIYQRSDRRLAKRLAQLRERELPLPALTAPVDADRPVAIEQGPAQPDGAGPSQGEKHGQA